MELSQIVANEVFDYIITNKDKFKDIFRMLEYDKVSGEDPTKHPYYGTYIELTKGIKRTIQVIIG